MADEARIVSPDLEKARIATGDAPVRVYSLRAMAGPAKAVQQLAERNLRDRSGGGKYTRAVAEVTLAEFGDGYAVALETPWFGMEFGGNVTNVWRNRVGTGRAEAIGLAPMWAPWHRDATQGYIVGQPWSEVTSDAELNGATADEVLKAYTAAYDKVGLKRG